MYEQLDDKQKENVIEGKKFLRKFHKKTEKNKIKQNNFFQNFLK